MGRAHLLVCAIDRAHLLGSVPEVVGGRCSPCRDSSVNGAGW